MAVAAIFSFVGTGNEILRPPIALSSKPNYTLALGLNRLRDIFYSDPRLVATGTVIVLVPIIAVFALLRRYFFRGLQTGGIKG